MFRVAARRLGDFVAAKAGNSMPPRNPRRHLPDPEVPRRNGRCRPEPAAESGLAEPPPLRVGEHPVGDLAEYERREPPCVRRRVEQGHGVTDGVQKLRLDPGDGERPRHGSEQVPMPRGDDDFAGLTLSVIGAAVTLKRGMVTHLVASASARKTLRPSPIPEVRPVDVSAAQVGVAQVGLADLLRRLEVRLRVFVRVETGATPLAGDRTARPPAPRGPQVERDAGRVGLPGHDRRDAGPTREEQGPDSTQ